MDIREPMTGIPSSTFTSRFLVVTLGGRYLALSAESVCGLLTPEEAGNVGSQTVHGRLHAAINLNARLSLPNDHGGANTRVVLLAEREARGSIRVTTVHGLLGLQPSQLLPLPKQFRGPERHWYRGMVLFANSIALVLNTAWVLHGRVSDSEDSGTQSSTHDPVAPTKMLVNDSQTC